MSLSNFLTALFEDGRVQVAPLAPLDPAELAAADAVLAGFERRWRASLAGEPPPFSAAAAQWGAVALYRSCQLVVYRDWDEPAIERTLSAKPPDDTLAASHYSVDLALRFLPDVIRLARAASDDDPLLARLAQLACQWPLSSVGAPGIDGTQMAPAALKVIVAHPALRALYVDRVLARQDASRLAHPAIRQAASEALGIYPELAPKIAEALNQAQAPK